eukprot:CAMPEP_0184870848 /NCGR_PEP_ID=MMETSP0580-20130426/39024_1 /TAXON_ID=1118495 /ORGANISM="Dactyliosolen fragilissimus" /LENGTH=167 /DNA_ID=CAMNT_0027373181 /DNA_START=519 /DNA_END=1022 /DNA_ORIENTATION=+
MGYIYFDPLELADESNFAKYREAELKHGRIAMLATLGNSLPCLLHADIFHLPEGLQSIQKTLHHKSTLQIVQDLPLLKFWLPFLIMIAFLETRILVQRDKRDMPGDYAIGYFGLRDKGVHERALVCELENGRLAMMAFLGQIVAEIVTGQTVPEQVFSITQELINIK